jgi:hypothetical protein
MKFEDLLNLNETGNHISFERISEPRTKEVRLRIVINKGNPTDLLTNPHPDGKVTTLQIDFPNYVTYSVIYDDLPIQNDDEIYQEKLSAFIKSPISSTLTAAINVVR